MTIRLDTEVMSALRAGGPGWQTRINALLRSKIKDGKIIMSPAKPAAKGKTVVATTRARSI